jgi:hypothetical protein
MSSVRLRRSVPQRTTGLSGERASLTDGYIGLGLARNELMTPSVKRVELHSPFFARRTIFFASWPISYPGAAGFCFCGNEPVKGLPYCLGHARIAYRPAGVGDTQLAPGASIPRASSRTRWAARLDRPGLGSCVAGHHSRQEALEHWREADSLSAFYLIRANPCLPMPKSRGRKPKKKRAQASAPKERLDNFSTTPQEPPLSTQPPQEPPLARAPREEQFTPRIKQIAKLTTAVVLAAIAIVLCAYAFILTKQ